ncbi:RidA family protein [Corynebacterium suicordis]|uniref:RidA family protein n=1 Tax=Corynebacterium suicordis DSM 45110 TaxID=1121369 RepID=A0ABR9ZH01_9CORY|nr:RidA family protein [Corynebacterium suicordis]MBF4552696.1 RidA family protein [Corynebacterium suicordis DSM 45110]MDR6278345.1 enamine deaminase RidA (YjgF/YER057c/UK114 family) [Corynebacterium suicordis]
MHSQRLQELGIELPEVAAPVAAYVPAVRSGEHVYTSGQLPFVNGELPEAGKVGAEVDPERAAELARIAALNAVAAAADLVGLDNIEQIVKVNGFVASAAGFNGQPGVINGASTVLQEIFGEAGVHARAAVGVAELPLNSPVEVDMVLRVRDTSR